MLSSWSFAYGGVFKLADFYIRKMVHHTLLVFDIFSRGNNSVTKQHHSHTCIRLMLGDGGRGNSVSIKPCQLVSMLEGKASILVSGPFLFCLGGKYQLKQEAKLVFVHLKERNCLMSASTGICLWAFGRKLVSLYIHIGGM